MNRRNFLTTSAGVATGLVAGLANAASVPCPPPGISVEGDQETTTCGTANPGSAPAWFANMSTGTWTAVAGTAGKRIADVLPNPVPKTGLSGENPASIMKAWTGGAVDQTRKEYILCANGGHADYPGNEAYAITMTDASPGWRRLSDPTPSSKMPQTPPVFDEGSNTGPGQYFDGRPRAMHNTFECFGDGRVWIPYMTSVTSGGGGSVNRVWSYDRNSLGAASSPLPWTSANLGPWTDYGPVTGINPNVALFGVAVFDRVTHRVYALAGKGANNTQWWYINTQGASIGKGVVSNSGQSFGQFGSWAVCAHDLRIIVAGDNIRNSICVLDLNTNVFTQVSNVAGAGYFDYGSGGVYVQANHTIGIGNPVALGSSIYKLHIPVSGGKYDPKGQWAWTNSVPSGSTIDIAAGAAYSKWNIVEDMGNGQSAIVYVGDIAGPVYVYKVPTTGL